MKKMVAIMVMVTAVALSGCGSIEQTVDTPRLGGAVSGIAGFGEGTEVKLTFAKVIPTWFDTFNIVGYVEVSKADAQDVIVHYVAPGVTGDENWYDVAAVYVKDSGSDKEIWSFEITNMQESVDPDGYARFAVKYVADGVEYWDNNGGYDYWLSFADRIAFGKSTVALDYSYYTVGPSYNPYPPQFSGYVYVKDIAYDKVVKVQYTTNDWVDTLELYPSYRSEEGLDGEKWGWSITFGHNIDSIQFAISYDTPFSSDWDNNLGDNYVITGSETVR